MNGKEAKELLIKYTNGLCTTEEKALVETYYNIFKPSGDFDLSEEELANDLHKIGQMLPLKEDRSPISFRKLISAAAAVLIILSVGIYIFNGSKTEKTVPKKAQVIKTKQDIAPGGNNAILTLANGKKVNLNDAAYGELAEQSGIRITKSTDGQLVYTIVTPKASESASAFNVIETPSGGQYQIKLPDGTAVWLNAESSLRYPLVFTGQQRKVELIGEAYFEVAHDKSRPFRVVSGDQTIEVLGTHFNVMVYGDEDFAKTTLLEGSVKVNSGTSSVVLLPGQQSIVAGRNIKVNNDPDLAETIAWKEGRIQFSSMDITSIMRMLARWYNFETEYTGVPVATTFGGSISRSKNLSEVLNVLEATGDVHFKIEGRRVIVMQ